MSAPNNSNNSNNNNNNKKRKDAPAAEPSACGVQEQLQHVYWRLERHEDRLRTVENTLGLHPIDSMEQKAVFDPTTTTTTTNNYNYFNYNNQGFGFGNNNNTNNNTATTTTTTASSLSPTPLSQKPTKMNPKDLQTKVENVCKTVEWCDEMKGWCPRDVRNAIHELLKKSPEKRKDMERKPNRIILENGLVQRIPDISQLVTGKEALHICKGCGFAFSSKRFTKKHKEYKEKKIFNCAFEYNDTVVPNTPPHNLLVVAPPPSSPVYPFTPSLSPRTPDHHQQQQQSSDVFFQQHLNPFQQLPLQPQPQPQQNQQQQQAFYYQPQQPPQQLYQLDSVEGFKEWLEMENDLQELCYIEEDGELEQEIGDIAAVNGMREFDKQRVTEAAIRHDSSNSRIYVVIANPKLAIANKKHIKKGIEMGLTPVTSNGIGQVKLEDSIALGKPSQDGEKPLIGVKVANDGKYIGKLVYKGVKQEGILGYVGVALSSPESSQNKTTVWAFLIPDIFTNTFNQSEMESELDKLTERMKELKVEISEKEMQQIRQQVENQLISKLKARLDKCKANYEKQNKARSKENSELRERCKIQSEKLVKQSKTIARLKREIDELKTPERLSLTVSQEECMGGQQTIYSLEHKLKQFEEDHKGCMTASDRKLCLFYLRKNLTFVDGRTMNTKYSGVAVDHLGNLILFNKTEVLRCFSLTASGEQLRDAAPLRVIQYHSSLISLEENKKVKISRQLKDKSFVDLFELESIGIKNPIDIAVYKFFNWLYILDQDSNSIKAVDFTRSLIGEITESKSKRFNRPTSIEINSKGNCIVSDSGNNRVVICSLEDDSSEGAIEINSNGLLGRPGKVRVDRHDNIFVCDEANNKVVVFNAEGSYLNSFSFNGKPLDVNAEVYGCIYVLVEDDASRTTSIKLAKYP